MGGWTRWVCLSLSEPRFEEQGEEAFLGWEKLRIPAAPARLTALGLSIKVTWVLAARAPARRSSLPAPAPSPPAPGPARYNYSPLIRPGPGKRLPQGGQSLWLPTAPTSPSPRPQLSHWATSQADPLLLAQGSSVTSEPQFPARLDRIKRKTTRAREHTHTRTIIFSLRTRGGGGVTPSPKRSTWFCREMPPEAAWTGLMTGLCRGQKPREN